MNQPLWSAEQSRKILSRIVIEGHVVLQTPAHFGNGDADDLTDMPLLVDPLDGQTPLLTGASIAGALRSYLREWQYGYGRKEEHKRAAKSLFGGAKGDDEGEQSPLVVNDSLGKNAGIEIREGVSINDCSRTAEHRKLFSLELWQAGTIFPLRFELVIREGDDDEALKCALATALSGLGNGITLGARKRRGYGEICTLPWRVKCYDLRRPEDLLDWLEHGEKPLADVMPVADIRQALGVTTEMPDKRNFLEIKTELCLPGSLLIRSGTGQDDLGPDMVHLHSVRADENKEARTLKPILSGTTIGGVLRARALKIVNTLASPDRAGELIEAMFGREMKEGIQPTASRVVVREATIEHGRSNLVQSRVSIDRFTGGARETALFDQQPVFGGADTTLTLSMRLNDPKEHEMGLMLLLLKDLWTEDLPFGGESSVGRGRLRGRKALLTYQTNSMQQRWTIADGQKHLEVKDQEDNDAHSILEKFVRELHTYLKGGTP